MGLNFYKAIFAFALSIILIKLLKPLSRKIGLVDKPNERKLHSNEIPLIGGVVIYLTLLVTGIFFFDTGRIQTSYYAAAGLLTIVGVLDDRFDLRVSIRVLAAFVAAGIMMYWGGVIFINLGDLFGFGEIILPLYLAVPFTLIACFGIINAMNMVDGVDGLSSGIAILAFISMLIILEFQSSLLAITISLISATLAFQVFNLQLSKRVQKIFMGDAGSMMIGFTLIMMICFSSQPTAYASSRFEPVTGLYFVALPLIDMVSTVLRRVKKGQSPFVPDRTHAHHIFLHAGFSARQTLVILLSMASMFNSLGVVLHYLEVPAWLQLLVFIILSAFYYMGIQHGFRLSHYFKRFL